MGTKNRTARNGNMARKSRPYKNTYTTRWKAKKAQGIITLTRTMQARELIMEIKKNQARNEYHN